jgi:alpha-galactosidase
LTRLAAIFRFLDNFAANEKKITVRWQDIGYPESLKASVRDLWSGKGSEIAAGNYSAAVPSYGTVVIRVKP